MEVTYIIIIVVIIQSLNQLHDSFRQFPVTHACVDTLTSIAMLLQGAQLTDLTTNCSGLMISSQTQTAQ